MPQWGRPSRGGVGRSTEEVEDVYRFQELESDEEKNGVLLEPGYQKGSNGKHFNPDELYFNDMDLRAWERRTAEADGIAYGDDYYDEDEGYYEDGGGVAMSPAEYEEFLFHRVLDKIRFARASGDANVQLSTEELEAYQSRLLRPRAPAVRPQARARPVSAPVVNVDTNNAMVNTSSNPNGSSSARSKKSQQRTSIFAPRPKKEKPSSRKRAPSSTVSETNNQPPPGFIVSGPNGQPMYAPINAYSGRMARDSPVRSAGSPSRPGSRSASMSSRQAPTPPRVTPPREIPGTFPSGSPQKYHRDPTPPRQGRPPSSSRQSMQDNVEYQFSPQTRSRSSSIQQPAKLVPFPVTDYQHYTAEPYQYHIPGQPAPSQQSSHSSSQPQYARRVVSGPADGNYMTMPRRAPVPIQRATAPMSNVQGSYSDPALGHRGPGPRGEESDEDGAQDGILIDVIPQAEDKGYKVQTAKSGGKEASNSGGGRDGERRRRSGRSKRKN